MIADVCAATLNILDHHFIGLTTIVDEDGDISMVCKAFCIFESVKNNSNAYKFVLKPMQISLVVEILLNNPKSDSVAEKHLPLSRNSEL